ncbi:MAG: IS1595 family transposase, partial [Terracidiphilus sp.]
MKPYTLSDIDRDFDTEEKCIAFLEGLRWPDGVTCVKCGKQHISRVRTVARGRSKGTKGTEWTRRLYECLGCGEQFSVKSGTLFHDTHLPLQKWFRAIVLVCEAKKGRSANETARLIGVSLKTGWYLCHRIRQAMQPNDTGLFGRVAVDEKYLGGKQTRKGVWYGMNSKQTIIGLKQVDGEIRLVHTPNARAKTIRRVVNQHLTEAVS